MPHELSQRPPSLFAFATQPIMGRRWIWFDPDQPPGSGNSDNGGQQAPPAASQPPAAPPDVLHAYQNLVQRHGDANAAALLLYQENFQYRERLRQLQEQLQQVQQQLPPDGAVILQGDQLTNWQAYQNLGTPDHFQHLQQAQRELTILRAAQTAGYKDTVLATLLNPNDTLEIATPGDGKDPIAYITPQNGERAPLTDYAKQHWPDFLPALQTRPAGTQFHQQHVGGGQPAPSLIEQRINARRERQKTAPHPFKPMTTH